MKVFELMKELANQPAGAEVEFRTLMTLAGFAASEVEVDDSGKDLYRISEKIEEVDKLNDNLVVIYS